MSAAASGGLTGVGPGEGWLHTAQAYPRQQDEQPQIALTKEPVQGGGAGEDVADFRQLRGLEGEGPDTDPVGPCAPGTLPPWP